jgi:hypothetical protein
MYMVLVGGCKGKRPLEKSRRSGEENITTDLNEI